MDDLQFSFVAENAARDSHGQLKELWSFFRTVVDSTPDFLVFKDHELTYRLVNSAFADFLERPYSDIIGKTDFELFPKHEAEQYRGDDAQVIETGESIVREEHVSGADGKRWLRVSKTPYVNIDGKTKGVLITVQDISMSKAGG